MRRSVTGGFALAIVAMTTAGCGSMPAGGQPSSLPAGSASASSSVAPATASPSPAPSPPDVPAGLPVMPGAEPTDPGPGVMARWQVDAIAPDVYRFYLDALPAADFVVTDRFPGGGVAVIRFSAPDGTALDLSLIVEGEGNTGTRIELRTPEGP